MTSKILQKLKGLFLITPIEKNKNPAFIDYQDELNKILYSNQGIIKKDNLEDYINSKFNKDLNFVGAVSVYGNTYQKEFSSLLYTLFHNYENTIERLTIKESTISDTFESINIYINNLYECYKDYIINLIQFYIDNPGFSYPLNCYPQTMLSEPFYEYVKGNPILLNYNNETRNLLYLKLIQKIVFARFLELKEDTLITFRNNLVKFTKSKNKEIATVSKKTRDKLYKYNGVKCPNHLIYISLISDKKAQILSEYIITRYFEKNTDVNALKLAFQGRLHISTENNEYYSSNPYFSNPLIIKFLKTGYISYIYEHLELNDYLVHDKKWDSIAKYKYYKYRKKEGEIEYVSSNKFSQSLSYKKQRINSKRPRTKN